MPTTDNNRLPDAIIAIHRRLRDLIATGVQNENVAARILHAAYTKAREKEHDLLDHERIIPWLFHLLRSTLAAGYRDIDNDPTLPPVTADMKVQRDHINRHLGRTVHHSMAELLVLLKPEHTTILKKIELKGLTLGDLAGEGNPVPGILVSNLRRAREAMKKKALQVFGACAEHGTVDCACNRGAIAPIEQPEKGRS